MSSGRSVLLGLGIVLCAVGHASAERALEVRALGKVALRIDGDLREWRGARFASLGEGADAAIEYALAYDADALYVGARVTDDDLVRTAQPSPAEDAVVLTLAVPGEGASAARGEVWLYAGVAGKQRAQAAIGSGRAQPKLASAIAIAEGPLAGRGGYVLEARVPWAAIPGGRDAQVARASLALHDVDGKPGASAATLATASGAELPPLLIEGGPHAAVAAFLRAKDLTDLNVRYDFTADALGDARLERVVLAGTFAVVAGPDMQAGNGFNYMELSIGSADALRDARVQDLTGDGKAELLVRVHQPTDFGARDLFQVIGLSQGQPRPLLTIETRRENQSGYVASDLRVGRAAAGNAAPIEARAGAARGIDAASDAQQTSPGIEPLLTPWGQWSRRVYRWDGARFAVAEQDENRAAKQAAAAQARAAASNSAASAGGATAHAAPPGADELIAAFRASRSIDPSLRASFTQHANFAEDAALESLQILGTDVLLIGKGYRGGTGYFYFSLPVHDAADIEHVFTGDVTGDGRRDLFVRARQTIGDVQRDILLGYTFTDAGIAPILAVEVRRAQGENSVGTRVGFAVQGGRRTLRISAGRAAGWDASSYPFEAGSRDAYEPLLLPWSERARAYRFEDGRLVSDAGADR
jgi:hypothetical protein